MLACLDQPAFGAVCDPLCFRADGWLFGQALHPEITAVELRLDGRCVGRTELLFARADVSAAHGWPAALRTGFTLFGHVPDDAFGKTATLTLCACYSGQTVELMEREVRFIDRDYRTVPHGKLLSADSTRPWRHDDIFGWGPSEPGGNADVLTLLRRYLPAPPGRLVDVGCGLGWYGRQLLADGHAWHGLEVKPSDCAALAAAGLPHTAVDGRTLPFGDGAFEAAMLIEVLEHIADPRAFLAEVCRVAPARLLVSVPNCELVTYLAPHFAVPWHMLEADHKNFFTRWNLAALLREFYPRVEVMEHTAFAWPTAEGSPLFYNLFAVASR